MLCVDGNLRKILEFTPYKQRSKRAAPNFSLSCVAPQFVCKGVSCSFCTDLDINPASGGSDDTLRQCLLKL
ncbi:hypothetical protein OESDEN_18289 [Oesophagostomum dentatum]|uniref:Uncharacterized protein n=1 Tax=Oesophagostomum dentatum TaxID=61180 RepID=A0A0B1SFM9_OESDE|nr:hypothetical protein OESDEN_18289 [Oesophagostomum dentatum]